MPFSQPRGCLEVELLITSSPDVVKKCVYETLCLPSMNYMNKNYWHFEIVYWYYCGFVSTKCDN